MTDVLRPIIEHPVAFAAGLSVLVGGTWALRKGGVAVLLSLAWAVAAAARPYLVELNWLPPGLVYDLAVYAAMSAVALVLARRPVVASCAELLFVAALCFLCGGQLANWLSWPEAAFWVVALAGAVAAPALTVAAFAAALFSLSLAVQCAWGSSVVLAVCVALAVLLQGDCTRR